MQPLEAGMSLNGSKLRGRIVVMTPGMRMPSGRLGSTLCSTQEACQAIAQEACDHQARSSASGIQNVGCGLQGQGPQLVGI